MNTPILSSTFFLTLLLMVGLFFFIRASVKDRTQQVTLVAEMPATSVLESLQNYFKQRAYQIREIDPQQQRVTFEGFVRPSWFLAIFLTTLAFLGLLCLALVLAFLYPSLTTFFLSLTLLSPLVGVFYWKKSGRIEQVSCQVEMPSNSSTEQQSAITVTGHRDELTQLQQTLPLIREQGIGNRE